jgi:hypothetical protein
MLREHKCDGDGAQEIEIGRETFFRGQRAHGIDVIEKKYRRDRRCKSEVRSQIEEVEP